MNSLQIDMKATGAKIKRLCKEKNITVKDIQKELSIGAYQSVYDWFSGKSLPSLDNFYYLSKLLKVRMEDMIGVAPTPVIMSLYLGEKDMNKAYLCTYFLRLSKSYECHSVTN